MSAANEMMFPIAPAMLLKLEPPLVLTCHWIDGDGVPFADAVNVAGPPGTVNWSAGFCVTTGGAEVGAGTVGNTFLIRLLAWSTI